MCFNSVDEQVESTISCVNGVFYPVARPDKCAEYFIRLGRQIKALQNLHEIQLLSVWEGNAQLGIS